VNHSDVPALLRQRAADAARQGYAPYSRFRVGAALRTAGGRVHVGCNVENAVFGLGICAERSAISAAVLAEGPGVEVVDIAIVAIDVDALSRPAPPCGACRQLLLEFGPDCRVGFLDAAGVWQQQPLERLLPFGFRLDPAR